MSFEQDFETECLNAIATCRDLGYVPTAWQGMINSLGAVEAARRLVVSGDIQSGFTRLVHMGRLDLTVEMAVLHPRWDAIFGGDRAVREAAWWRVAQAGRRSSTE